MFAELRKQCVQSTHAEQFVLSNMQKKLRRAMCAKHTCGAIRIIKYAEEVAKAMCAKHTCGAIRIIKYAEEVAEAMCAKHTCGAIRIIKYAEIDQRSLYAEIKCCRSVLQRSREY